MSSHRMAVTAPVPIRRFWPPTSAWLTIARHLVIPLFLGTGMALAYLGSFHEPVPHDFPVAVVGQGPAAQVFAQTLNDAAPGRLQVTTVPTEDAARQQVIDQRIAAAYVPSPDHATLLVSSAVSETAASAAQKVFLPIAYQQHLPVQIDDVRPGGAHDPTGQGLFFLLVGLSIGSYASAIALSATTAKLGIGWRMVAAAGTALVLGALTTLVAGPLYHVLDGNEWGIWLVSALYAYGIITLGLGLHPLLGKWTMPVLVTMFVMLNFTSSGGIFPATLTPEFFSGLTTFWNGAAWLDATRALTYFPGQQFGWDGLRLALWAAAGMGLIAASHLATARRRRLADDTVPATAAEEEEVVAAG